MVGGALKAAILLRSRTSEVHVEALLVVICRRACLVK